MRPGRIYGLKWTALKTLVFAAVVPGTVTVFLPFALLTSRPAAGRFNSLPLQIAGVLAVLAGALAGGWCFWLFVSEGKGTPAPIDPPKTLVVSGPYRFTRNPMYLAVTTILLGESAFFGSGALLLYAGLCLIGFNLFVRFYEEPALRRKFGPAYDEHCRTVSRWIPGRQTARPKNSPPH